MGQTFRRASGRVPARVRACVRACVIECERDPVRAGRRIERR